MGIFGNLFGKSKSDQETKKEASIRTPKVPDPILSTIEGAKVKGIVNDLTKRSEGHELWKVAVLAGVSKDERRQAYEGIRNIGDAVRILTALLNDPDRNVRGCSAEALGYLGIGMGGSVRERISAALIAAIREERFMPSECCAPWTHLSINGMASQTAIPVDNGVMMMAMAHSIKVLGQNGVAVEITGTWPKAFVEKTTFDPVFDSNSARGVWENCGSLEITSGSHKSSVPLDRFDSLLE